VLLQIINDNNSVIISRLEGDILPSAAWIHL